MKKLILIACCMFSVGAWASCEDLNRIADKKGIHYGTEYSFVVKGPKDIEHTFILHRRINVNMLRLT